ncbi:helicase-exonuclease AddAB subunit AddA [Rossellomorea vietnamensis]|uniref:ATP-dependent helicase/nuclease subunit A n=1 Tax=Rossellomorea vietnamensis TaxID=218284 RepID=A0A5D4KKJ3_9BACI|nr:helicase-exonuclease AddAB subunit AddA [Rossellomorea vietnamensis]TYR77844.1 helicase-exonuclease AddAB subunit AddA [Rossellomorea vietnamensis]
MNNIPMKPEDATWTDDQWKAIWAKGRDILVAAAAGSGKTAVLVERIIQKMLDKEDGINVDELLVVTFTNASAAEMRHRIGTALEKAITADPGSYHLRKQLSLLNRASISTLHSFCLEVIRKYYYLIDIDPGFRILDDTEGELLRDEVLDELFEEEYGKEGNDSFYKLVDTFTNDRSDAALQDMIRKLYDFSRSHPDPDAWLGNLVDMYDVEEEGSIDDLPFIEALKFDILLNLKGAEALFQQAYDLSKEPGGPAPRAENFLDDLSLTERISSSFQQSWTEGHAVFQSIKFSRLKPCKGEEYDPGLVEEAKVLRDKGKKMIEKIAEDFFSRKPETYLKDMKKMKAVVQSLVEAVRGFSQKFHSLKNEKGVVDFADLEHFCLEILMEKGGAEGLQPSFAALQYRKQFKEVLVDEYQDTNLVQESILGLVTSDQESAGNLFMVGDVKQSIYRFRLAEPNLFLGKYNRFTPSGGETGMKIDLSRNFRSRMEVLDGTNFLFKQIMGVNVGDIEYDHEALLVKGAAYPEDEKYPIEVAVIDQSDGGVSQSVDAPDMEGLVYDEADLEKSVVEARYMALKIKELIGGGKEIYDPKAGRHRQLQYKDIVILLRSMPWAPEIMEEFKKQGIPIYANLSTGYFEATEVAIMLSLLKVIDNPYQDIPLVSVLRSPIVGIDEEGLAEIRIHSKSGTYYEAVQKYIRKKPDQYNEEVHEKVSRFLSSLTVWRTKARQGALAELVWQLYRDTRFYDFAGGMPGGKQRQANLRALYDRARQYEETSFRGLFRFLRFIDRMRERGDDLGAARALSEQEDVVRMMTIHSSKGLEFPIVFVAGLSRQFNLMDLNQPYLLDKEYGFASKYLDPDNRISYPSLPQLAFKRKKRLETIAEEMRVLYVALTRAKEKLYLIGTVKDAEKSIKQWNAAAHHQEWLLPDFERAKALSFMDWIGPALVRHKDCSILSEGGSASSPLHPEIGEHPSCWKLDVIPKSQFLILDGEEDAKETEWLEKVKAGLPLEKESPDKEEVVEALSWRYPFPEAAVLPSKQSVSEIKRMFEISDEASSDRMVRKIQKPVFRRPKFLQEKELTPAEIGTAMHMVMQHISFSEMPDEQSLGLLLEDLKRKELLTDEQAEAIDQQNILGFFKSNMGQRVLRAEEIHREVPFSMAVPVQEIDAAASAKDSETVLVQGIIDLIFRDENGLVLMDYKTDGIEDRYKGGFEEAKPILLDRYRVQVGLYTKAVERIWKETINERYLYFFDGSHVLNVEKE